MVDQIKNDKNIYFKLIQKVGSHGRYQVIIALVILLQWFVLGAIQLSISLLFLDSTPNCSDVILNDITCYQYVCSLQQSQWVKFYPNKANSLRFAFGDLFICNKEWIISLMESMVFIGCLFSNLIFSHIPDNYGRKFSFLITCGTGCIGLILLSISWHISVAGIGLFMIGLGIDQTQAVCFMILYEQVKEKPRQYYFVFTQVAFTFGGMAVSAIFYVMSNWRHIVIFVYLIPGLTAFGLLYFLQQNPKYIMKLKGLDKALESLGRIAKMNGLQQNPVTPQDIQKAKTQQQLIQTKTGKTITFRDVIRYKSLLVPTAFLSIINCCLIVLYYGPEFIIQHIGLDAKLNQAVILGCEMITFPVAFLIITSIPRKKSGIATFILCGLATGASIFVKGPYIQLGLFAFFRFWVLYCIELIPEAARGISSGISYMSMRIFNFIVPFLIQFFYDRNWNPMILFTFVGFLGMIIALPLKQTLNQPLMEQIPQLVEQDNLKERLISTETENPQQKDENTHIQ